MNDQLQKILDLFGYEVFKPGQQIAIEAVLNKNDVFVSMSTSGGKSLCFQGPALLSEASSIVISPLISLMQDQVTNLNLKFGPMTSVFLGSAQTNDVIIENAKQGLYKIVYITPEFAQSFNTARNNWEPYIIAIDEAHCISEYGSQFRTSYSKLNILKTMYPNSILIALSASAKPEVRNDIIRSLQMKNPIIILETFNRPNLSYIIAKKSETDIKNIADLVKIHKTCIIYAPTRDETLTIATKLETILKKNIKKDDENGEKNNNNEEEEDVSIGIYHAGLTNEVRNDSMTSFKTSKGIRVIVATIAFGLGIDIPDIRLIIHYGLPKSLEGYYQESGRAGRDSLSATCILYWSDSDLRLLQHFANDRQDLNNIESIIQYATSNNCRRANILKYFNDTNNTNVLSCTDNDELCDVCINNQSSSSIINNIVKSDNTPLYQAILLHAIIEIGGKFGKTAPIDYLKGSENIKTKRFTKGLVFGLGKTSIDWNNIYTLLISNKYVVSNIVKFSGSKQIVYEVSSIGNLFLNKYPNAINEFKELLKKNVKESISSSPPSSSSSSSKSKKSSRVLNTQKLFNDNKSIVEIANTIGVSEDTIITYLCSSETNRTKLLSIYDINSEYFNDVKTSLDLNSNKMKEARQNLCKKYPSISYDIIKIVKSFST